MLLCAHPLTCLPACLPCPALPCLQLEDWEAFDVFKLARLTDGRPLQAVALALLRKRGLVSRLGLPEERLRSFLADVEEAYHPHNPYHNSMHAADVTQVRGRGAALVGHTRCSGMCNTRGGGLPWWGAPAGPACAGVGACRGAGWAGMGWHALRWGGLGGLRQVAGAAPCGMPAAPCAAAAAAPCGRPAWVSSSPPCWPPPQPAEPIRAAGAAPSGAGGGRHAGARRLCRAAE